MAPTNEAARRRNATGSSRSKGSRPMSIGRVL
jgi:hypothetical protein